ALPGWLGWTAGHWTNLSAFVRDHTIAPATAYRDVVRTLARLFEPAARAIAAELGPARCILDVGAGTGVWDLPVAELAAPTTRITALDLPEVIPAFAERAAALGLSHLATSIAGDYHTADLEPGFDRILLANVLHLEQLHGPPRSSGAWPASSRR